MLIKLNVNTSKHTQMLDITDKVQQAIDDSGVKDGICTVFIYYNDSYGGYSNGCKLKRAIFNFFLYMFLCRCYTAFGGRYSYLKLYQIQY